MIISAFGGCRISQLALEFGVAMTTESHQDLRAATVVTG
jgi:hypothetical protein